MPGNTMSSAEDRPHGPLRGPFMCQMINRDGMRLLRATDTFDEWPPVARQAEDLVIVFGSTDDAGRRWSYLVDGAAFRAAVANGFGSDASPMDLTDQILGYLAGWPDDWDAEGKAESARARADSAEKAMARARARDRLPTGPVRGGLTYVPSPEGREIGIFEGRDDAGQPWTIRFEGYALRAAIAEVRTLEAPADSTSAVT